MMINVVLGLVAVLMFMACWIAMICGGVVLAYRMGMWLGEKLGGSVFSFFS